MATARPRRAGGRRGPHLSTARPLAAACVAALAVAGAGAAAAQSPATAVPTASPHAGNVVLLVHTGDVTGVVADVLAHARAGTASSLLDIRHTFPADHVFSVAVPAAGQAAAQAALLATPGVTSVERPVTRTFSAVPDDPRYASEASYLSAVDAPAAWDVTHGSRAVRIAVVDSGIDVHHPDLAAKIVGTYDADNGGATITDDVGHGTFVAGVAAAGTNNGIGVAGAGYDTALLGVKIADAAGDLSIDDEIAGINWAVANHADIINLSLSGTDASAAEQAAVEHAIAKGVLVVAAAGNDGTSVRQYPAAYPGVVAVGATDTAAGRRASFSSYGPWVTLAAPGARITGTSPTAGSQFFPSTSGYAVADGTSFSTPLVAGEAALLKAADPAVTLAQLRQALVASAHGFAGQGLGAGQVDFAAALTHLPPTAAPTSAGVVGSADRVTLTASAASPAVEFRVDGGPWTPAVPVDAGTAGVGYDTWGLADGTHTVAARACTSFGECGAGTAGATFALANTAPTLLDPATGSTSTGRFTVTAEHPSGGGARLLLDGRPAGFAATSPYAFPVNASSLRDGDHTVQVVACSSTGTSCDGPADPARTITTRALHPVITALTKPVISPNGDRSGDTAALHFTLPDTETVTVQTLTTGGQVARSDAIGTLTRGAHTWTWRGLGGNGARLPDGRYTLALQTVAPSGPLAGYAATAGGVDDVAPHLLGLTGDNATFYPVRDGYHDTFAPGVTATEAGTLVLTVRNVHGGVVRALAAYRTGRTALVWDGRDARGRPVPPGRYRWQYSIVDAAGNRAVAGNDHVQVSGLRLVARVAYVQHLGSVVQSSGGTDSCATARTRGSVFAHGLALSNGCTYDSGDFAYASYAFTVPAAVKYGTVTVQVYGRSVHRPSELDVALNRVDGALAIPAGLTISRSGSRWSSVASQPAADYISGRRAYLSVLLTGRYPGRNDYDLQYVRLRLTYTALG